VSTTNSGPASQIDRLTLGEPRQESVSHGRRRDDPRPLTDRRTFLKIAGAASARALFWPGALQAGRKVVVLGGGLAGLAAAWNLMRRGYEVVVLEAQARGGGRVQTIREPFKNGGYAEAGAVRIPSTHDWTMKYIRLMGLESKLWTTRTIRGRISGICMGSGLSRHVARGRSTV
jgi:hypothetical protein